MSLALKIPALVEVSPSGRVKYPRSYKDYGEIFDRTAVAVRGWVRTGKKVGELPPLDQPLELVLWWRRWMTQKVPDGIQSAAVKEQEDGVAPPLELEGDPDPPAADDPVMLDMIAGGNASESLDRLRSATRMCYAQYKKALADGDRAQANNWRKDWLEAEEKQRHWEKDIGGILKARGEMVDKSSITGALASLAVAMRRNFVAALVTYGEELDPQLGEDELRRRAKPHIDVCFERLRESEFSAALQGVA